MKHSHLETQQLIKRCIEQYIERSPLNSHQISIQLLNKSTTYLATQLREDRMIGLAALETLSAIIPIPAALRDRAASDYRDRLKLRGKRIQSAHAPQPWTQTVATFLRTRPLEHRRWGHGE